MGERMEGKILLEFKRREVRWHGNITELQKRQSKYYELRIRHRRKNDKDHYLIRWESPTHIQHHINISNMDTMNRVKEESN